MLEDFSKIIFEDRERVLLGEVSIKILFKKFVLMNNNHNQSIDCKELWIS